MVMLYSSIRIIIEFFRVGPHIGWISYSQIMYLILLIGSAGVFIYRYKKKS